ncbi:hypothetical protein CROQUDRAFT_50169 [Cronartium quercuum f. sp. fusiforme G11]|uniref:DUF4110 domain-containing protein n=1 Tax=Cronartium quercuum f. sp. fusiforme G11 TaxID=708437 RepID=A0A9P6NE29_9BASI|nr:hypothetical protein CROQUDRAFT_50169 [Cronartium quercuum f. sp. fusiforme G11]
MAKTKKGKANNKAAVKAAKKEKQAKNVEQKSKKQLKAEKALEEEDLLVTLEEFRKKWENDHKVTEDVIDGPPSRRANASLTPDPVNPHLWLFGGEFFDGTSAFFYNDLYRYSPDKNEWRRYSSPTFPGPRSAHQIVATPAGGGKLWLFGGEFASVNQTSFHHYRDLWCFDLATHTWERINTKAMPSARSGHRMTVWKQWIILFGGFHDVGVRTNYLNDLWVFDTLEYKWQQFAAKDTERWPSPRSGFSLLSTPEGIVLHGGYCKIYTTKTKSKGVVLDDTFFLKLDGGNTEWTKILKWDKRKKIGTIPNLRSGSTMVNWVNKMMGVGFGGVLDVADEEEGLVSEFYNDLYAYQLTGNGCWMLLNLKKKKKRGGGQATRKKAQNRAQVMDQPPSMHDSENPIEDEEMDEEDRVEEAQLRAEQTIREELKRIKQPSLSLPIKEQELNDADNADDPEKSIPLARYNPMLAVLKNTLYIYGGIFESGDREYTLQSFYSLALDKLDRFMCLRDDDIQDHEWNEEVESSASDDDDADEDKTKDDVESNSDSTSSNSGEEDKNSETRPDEAALRPIAAAEDQAKASHPMFRKEDLRKRAEAFIGVSKATERSTEEVMSTPSPGESLKKFYDRTREYWAQKAHGTSQHRGKELRRDVSTWSTQPLMHLHHPLISDEYKPLLDEIERIQAGAGIEATDVQHRTRPGASGVGQESRHRR